MRVKRSIEHLELQELLSALCDEGLSESQQLRLYELLENDALARRFYIDYLHLDAGLRWDWGQLKSGLPAETGSGYLEKGDARQSPVLGWLGDLLRRGGDLFSRPMFFSILVAIGLPLLCILLLVTQVHPPEIVDAEPVTVATLSRTLDSAWGDKASRPVAGEPLSAGRRLELAGGLAQITMTGGTTVILEGPATMVLDSDRRVLLETGKLAAEVPKAAIGFTVQTPQAVVVDLGTDFGVSVDAEGATEAHVFAGSVEVAARAPAAEPSQSAKKLRVGQAVKIRLLGAGKTPRMEAMAAAPGTFVRRVPPADNTGLPEPRILFAHRGDRDPTTEGWKLHWNTRRGMKADGCKMVPIDDQAAAAWSIDDRSGHNASNYQIAAEQGLTREVVARAKANGWVMRARVKVVGGEPAPDGLCFCSYWGDDREWLLRPTIDPSGNQSLYLPGRSSLGWNMTVKIPDSRDRYVDYEVRYHPKTNDADVYVDGKLVATGCYKPRSGKTVLHFGTFMDKKAEVRFARVEWGILGP